MICLLALAVSALVVAQDITIDGGSDADSEAGDALRRYNVEIVVFAHTDVDPGEESFRGTGAADTAGQSIDDRTVFADAAAGARLQRLAPPPAEAEAADGDLAEFFGQTEPDDRPSADFRVLSPEEYQLGDAAEVVDRLGAYQLLGHGGWQQNALDEPDAIAFDIARLGMRNPSGTLRLYVGRFLHIAADLAYRDRLPGSAADIMPAEPATVFSDQSDRRFGSLSLLSDIDVGERFAIHTERNAVRSGELHYIDHPRFGLIFLITPVPTAEEDAEEAAAGETPAA